MQPSGPLRRAFMLWVAANDRPDARAALSHTATLTTAATVGLLALLMAWGPARALFGVSPALVALAFVPELLLSLTLGFVVRRPGRLTLRDGLLLWASTFTLRFFVAVLAARAEARGAFLFGGFFIFVAAAHGWMSRTTLRQPFPALTTLLAAAVGALLAREQQNAVVLLVVVGPAVFAELHLGTMAVAQERERLRSERMRAALQAQMLRQQEKDVDRLASSLLEVRRRCHDARHALDAAGAALDLLSGLGAHRGSHFERVLGSLRGQLSHIEQLVAGMRDSGRSGASGGLEPAELATTLEAVRESVALLFPEVEIALCSSSGLPSHVRMQGGTMSLRRVLENLLVNACEGNGQRAARHVQVGARLDVTGARVELWVSDDGPGFSPEQLSRPIEGLVTTKPQGEGLGLYTAECLVVASAGSLTRGNTQEGGAHVTLLLHRDDALPQAA